MHLGNNIIELEIPEVQMRVSVLDVGNFNTAMLGMRLSYNSTGDSPDKDNIGERDLALARNLVKNGHSHSKFLRFMTVVLDIDAPLYWWKQMDQYKVCTTSLSESTMHTIHKRKFSQEMFELPVPNELLSYLNTMRDIYLTTKDKTCWNNMINSLPSGFLQRRLVHTNYQVLRTIHFQRKGHKLKEWSIFIGGLKCLPYYEDFIL